MNPILDPHTQKVKFAFADIDGIMRGKIISREKFEKGWEEGYGFCNVVFGWDSNDTAYDNATLTGWHSGYPDTPVRIDTDTLRTIPWEDNMPFFLADFSNPNGEDLPACPRSLLRRIKHQCEAMGFHAEFAQEFEWFNFRETPQSLQQKGFRNLEPLTPGMFGYSILRPSLESSFNNDLFDLLTAFDIPLEGLHTETGPGVYEAAIKHDEVLRAADKAALFKTAVKEIGYRHGIIATFMAKWNAELPGCSGHIHQSLWNPEQTKNLFYDESSADRMSPLMKHYLAGQLHCLPHVLPMYAPTINSYKRLVEGAWAPTTLTWAIDNRTTALRVLNNGEAYTRLENRVPGSDSNPYLAIAASLASGLYGIKHQLSLDVPPTVGNGYTNQTNGIIPANLRQATEVMKHSSLAKELFGEGFVEHFTQTRDWEWRQYARQVSEWELKRYFEII
ncbi:glutamine synthetase family protein [Siphonobacter sp. SORGH_AS_0500]|uniref:glutamine synthetase family protein n=1 Tax=Siphonobacter sp. SORGH_AS_0500 TaxID=1864824 RepID=UPI0028549872|nr:glutamine synthetase family protein [Siphonobacter sp. SORGH_AS_0500]MDR6196076.1 glutamine synthetase [Siphonobacter sp. SORGH_AS_0500]